VNCFETFLDLVAQLVLRKDMTTVPQSSSNVRNDGNCKHVECDLIDFVAEKLPSLFTSLFKTAIYVIRLIVDAVFVALESDNIGKVFPSPKQNSQLLTHFYAIFATNDQETNAAVFNLLGKLTNMHGFSTNAIVFSKAEFSGGRTVDGQNEKKDLTALVVFV
jgi:hypothetical protein